MLSSPVPPPQPRYRLTETPTTLDIIIPASRQIFATLFLVFWLIGWALGETFVIALLLTGGEHLPLPPEVHPSSPTPPDHLFLLGWLLMWSIGGAAALYTILWNLGGREHITVGYEGIRIRREIFGIPIGRTRLYAAEHIGRLRPTQPDSRIGGQRLGAVSFDYANARTITFGKALSEAEARQLIADIVQRFPRYRSREEGQGDTFSWA